MTSWQNAAISPNRNVHDFIRAKAQGYNMIVDSLQPDLNLNQRSSSPHVYYPETTLSYNRAAPIGLPDASVELQIEPPRLKTPLIVQPGRNQKQTKTIESN